MTCLGLSVESIYWLIVDSMYFADFLQILCSFESAGSLSNVSELI